MSEVSQERRHNFSVKVGHYQPILTVREDDFNTFISELMNYYVFPEVKEFIDKFNAQPAEVSAAQEQQAIAAIQQAIPGTVVVQPPTSFAPVPPPAPQAPAVVAPAATDGARHCKHGEMTYRTGTNKQTGKPWAGYFCPSPKGTPDQCSPQFGK